ncbi:MAG: hypothetical protein ABIQ32_03170 [Sphingomicrobium sp.]
MKAFKYLLAGGAGLAALAVAAPASAQYYPGYGGGNVLGQVLGQVLSGGAYGGGYGGGYGMNSQAAVQQCAAAITQRINSQYGGGYGGYGGGYGAYGGYGGGARVVSVTNIQRRSNGRLRIEGIAQSSAYGAGYGGYGGGYQGGGDLTFRCDMDYRGYITNTDLNRIGSSYGAYGGYSGGYGGGNYSPYGSYRRY